MHDQRSVVRSEVNTIAQFEGNETRVLEALGRALWASFSILDRVTT